MPVKVRSVKSPTKHRLVSQQDVGCLAFLSNALDPHSAEGNTKLREGKVPEPVWEGVGKLRLNFFVGTSGWVALL